ncbi:MAG: hypothetical protein ABI782_11625 [Anaerolineaceae bacterium]
MGAQEGVEHADDSVLVLGREFLDVADALEKSLVLRPRGGGGFLQADQFVGRHPERLGELEDLPDTNPAYSTLDLGEARLLAADHPGEFNLGDVARLSERFDAAADLLFGENKVFRSRQESS